MQQIQLKRGLDLKMEGAAAKTLTAAKLPSLFRVVPDQFAGVTPKMVVKAGDVVKAGSPLFYDKAFPEVLFTSPVSGTVTEVVRGDRRKVMSINIEADAKTAYAAFDMKKDTKALLLESGLWALLKQRPYDCIAMPSKSPKAIFISAFCAAPLAPDYEWLLGEKMANIQTAIDRLAAIAPVYVGIRPGSKFAALKGCTLFEVVGPHPAGNVSVQINHVLPMAKNDTMFCLNIQDAELIGRFFTTGQVDMQKTVAVTGPMAAAPQYFTVLAGMPLDFLQAKTDREVRFIAGNALSGHKVELTETVSLYDNQYTIIAEGTENHEFMGWLVRVFGIQGYRWDARLKGGRRAIIVSNEYEKVFPMDIYPEFLIKAMIAGNIDKMLELGVNEVAPEDFALCEYLCTSKMPLQAIVRQALDNLKKEIE